MKRQATTTMNHHLIVILAGSLFAECSAALAAPSQQQESPKITSAKDDGYRGIWFTLGQKSEFGDKYSGGLGTYTANHVPMAIYAKEANKTFFVYGGGKQGQAEAIKLGLARALKMVDIQLAPQLRKANLLTRDPRMKERKKYGQKGARKRFQYSKR